jgi:hypothetical protein
MRKSDEHSSLFKKYVLSCTAATVGEYYYLNNIKIFNHRYIF